MVGRHPVSFLFLEIPPAMVDVNVHPTKSEVRFQDSQILYRQMLKTLRDKFLTLEFRSNIEVSGAGRASSNELQFDKPVANARPQRELDIWASQATLAQPPRIGDLARPSMAASPGHRSSANDRSVFSNPAVIAALAVEPHQRREHFSEESPENEFAPAATATQTATSQTATSQTTVPSADHDSTETAVLPDSKLQSSFDERESADSTATASDRSAAASPYEVIDRPLGNEFRAIQIHDCYIVVASEAGLEVIDQHALHERILYEHLRNRILAGGVERQRLLIPDTIECTATECVALLESLDLLKEIGFELQEFGGTTILLMSHPTLIPRGNLARIVKDFAEQLVQNDGKMSRRDLLDHMLHTMACKAAIKSGHRLTPEEMQELLRQRHLVDDSHHCPHGRPTSLTLSRGTLDQQFGRLG